MELSFPQGVFLEYFSKNQVAIAAWVRNSVLCSNSFCASVLLFWYWGSVIQLEIRSGDTASVISLPRAALSISGLL